MSPAQAMTAEEWAAKVVAKYGPPYFPPDSDLVAAFRAAVNEALEQAAVKVEDDRLCTAQWVGVHHAELIRALKEPTP